LVLCLARKPWLSLPAALVALGCVEHTGPVLVDTLAPPGPAAVTPLPSADQQAWQKQELSAFFHFGINTFTDKEQGDGTDSPTVFNPTALDPTQWMTTLSGAGFRRAMLTAKHRDGFCLWPTSCTTYSVKASLSWMGGRGDVVRQFVDAAHQAGIRVGLALHPSDRHEPTFGTPAYLNVFRCQLTELLTNYGAIDEIWLWGQPGPQPAFNWNDIRTLVHQLQPHTLVNVGNLVAVAGADVRSTAQAVPVPPADQRSVQPDPAAPMQATIWYPAEAVFRTRPGWFWHAPEDARLATLAQLIDFYYDSVGRNSVLLLNLSPDRRGLLSDVDVAAMDQYGTAIRAIYQSNLVAARPATADSVFKDAPAFAASMAVDGKLDTFWAAAAGTATARLEFDLGGERMFNLVSIQEPIALGERIMQHHIEAKVNGAWTTIASGTTVGQRKLHRLGAVTATAIALVITGTRAPPAIAELGAYPSRYP
jgi:alpha-L-fucosidase